MDSGPVKELIETPLKKHQKFMEFYDVRYAAKALREMNGKEINGKQVVIESSRPGGYSRKLFNGDINAFTASTSKYNPHTRNLKYLSSPPPPLPPLLAPTFSPNNILPRSFMSRSQFPTMKAMDSSKENPSGNSNIKCFVVGMAAI